VLTEEVVTQQQALAVTEGPLQNVTITRKQCEATFVFTKGEQQIIEGKSARDARDRFVKSERKQLTDIDSSIVPLGLNSELR